MTCRSQAPAGQPELAAFSTMCGSKTSPCSATWARVSVEQPRRRLPGEAGAAVVEQGGADGQDRERLDAVAPQLVLGPDAAPQQQRRRLVGARGQHHDRRLDARGRPPSSTPATRPSANGHAVDEGRAEHLQVRRARGRDRRRRTPRSSARRRPTLAGIVVTPTGCAGSFASAIGPSRDAGRPRGTPRGTAPGAPCWRARRRASHPARSKNGAKTRPRPRRPPLVVVGRRADDHHAGVVGGAAAEHARAQRAAVLPAPAPVVRVRQVARVEQVVGPAAVRAAGHGRAPPRAGRPYRAGSSLRRAASTQPAVPPPTTTTSKASMTRRV